MKNLSVVLKALIVKDKRILIIRRSLDEKIAPGVWELVGGRLQYNETLEEGLIREVKEEISINCSIIRLLYATDHTAPTMGKVVILVYLCEPSDEEVMLSIEHMDYKWVDLEQFRELVFSQILNDLNKYGVLDIEELK
jgi:8-oxo-dGTP diphosphatase